MELDEDSPAEHSVDLAMELVLAHVRRYPRAADTLEGIATWWLGENGASIPPDALTLALERLANNGVLASRKLPCEKMLWYVLQVPSVNPSGNRN